MLEIPHWVLLASNHCSFPFERKLEVTRHVSFGNCSTLGSQLSRTFSIMLVSVVPLNYPLMLLVWHWIGDGTFPKNWPFYEVMSIETDG